MRIARQNPADLALVTGVQMAALTLILVERFEEAASLVETAISGARRVPADPKTFRSCLLLTLNWRGGAASGPVWKRT